MRHEGYRKILFTMAALMLIGSLLITGCGGAADPTVPTTPTTPATPTTPTPSTPSTPETPTTPAAPAWEWPETIHLAARGTSGMAKTVSFISVMEAETGSTIRVRPEALNLNIMPLLENNEAIFSILEKSAVKSYIEANDEYAGDATGPAMVGNVWVSSLGSSGFMVRGDSDIFVPGDIKAGTKVAVNSMKEGSTGPVKALFNWAGLDPENDIVWVNTGSSEAVPRAVAEGRAAICFTPPISPSTYDAASSPYGIRFINMNPNDDPEGHKRFLDIRPMYTFFPSQSGPKETVGTWMPTGYTMLVSGYNSDPDLIYNIAKWLDENFALYEDKYASNKFMTLEHLMESLTTTFIPTHPGLVRYLKEKELWTPAHEARDAFNKAWLQSYVDAWGEALERAESQSVKVDALNDNWLEIWENQKKESELALIGMHPSLTENAKVQLPPGYTPPEPEPVIEQPKDIIVEFAEIKGFHPGERSIITIRTEPGAEVWLVFTMPTGNDSKFPENQPQIADANGLVVYEWDSHSTIPGGFAFLTATAKKDGKEGVLQVKKVF